MKWLLLFLMLVYSQPTGLGNEDNEVVRSYLTRTLLFNNGAIHIDAFLLNLASNSFDIVINQMGNEGHRLRRINPNVFVLKYFSLMESNPYLRDYENVVNYVETAFLHGYEPSSFSIYSAGDSIVVKWVPDRRYDDIIGYFLRISEDSSYSGYIWGDSLITACDIKLYPPSESFYVYLESVRSTGAPMLYSFIHKVIVPELSPYAVCLDSIYYQENLEAGFDTLRVWLNYHMLSSPDSLILQLDINRDKSFASDERVRMIGAGGHYYGELSWMHDNSCKRGRMFRFLIYHGASVDTFPQCGVFTTSVNNRIKNDYGNFVMNISNEFWREFAISQIESSLQTDNYNGVFLDGAVVKLEEYMIDIEGFPIEYDSLTWKSDQIEIVGEINSIFSNDLVLFNGLAQSETETLLTVSDGGLFEHWLYSDGPVPYNKWVESINLILRNNELYRKLVIPFSSVDKNNVEGRLYVFASFLLVKSPYTVFGNSDDYSEFSLFPEMGLDLGTPLTSAQLNIGKLQDPSGCYVRYFDKGVVIVNPTDQALTYNGVIPHYRVQITPGTVLEGSKLFTVNYDSSSVELSPYSAAIFVTQPISTPEIDKVTFLPETPSGFCDNLVMVHVDYIDTVRVEMSLNKFAGSPDIQLYDDGTRGDSLAGDSMFSALFSLVPGFWPHEDTIHFVAYSGRLASIKNIVVNPIAVNPHNRLYNWSFEIDLDENRIPDVWKPYGNGFFYDTTGINALSGTKSIKCESISGDSMWGIYYILDLNQEFAHSVTISAFSKAVDVGGEQDENYAIYADVYCKDGSVLYGEYASFPTGTHGWVYSKRVIQPPAPIEKIYLYLLFKYHAGTVWFDDVGVYEAVPMDVDEKGELKIDKPDFYFTVIPNPVGDLGILRAYVPGKEPRVLRLYNTAGRLVRTFGLKPGLNLIRWETGDLPNGAYFLYSESPKRTLKTLILK